MYEGMPVQLADEDNDDNLEVCYSKHLNACRGIIVGEPFGIKRSSDFFINTRKMTLVFNNLKDYIIVLHCIFSFYMI